MQRLRIATVIASALVMVVNGAAWGLYRELTAGITTTNVIVGGSDRGPQNILLVGVDSRTDAQGNPLPPEVLRALRSGAEPGVLNADTIMLLHVPDGGGRAVAFSIPRDAYVDIPGYRRDKINAAYPATKALAAAELVAGGVRDRARIEAESAQLGRGALVRIVEDLTGVEIDHYAEINLLGFYHLTTALGGVEVCLRSAVDEPLSGARFAAGAQTISGADVLAFVRQRHGLPGGDLSRIRRQQVFLAAVTDKILSSDTLTDPGALAALVDVARRSLVIDAGWDVLAFARHAADIAAGDMEFVTIPTRGPQSNARGDVVVLDRSDVRGFVEERIAAGRPSALDPSRYTVDVLNASGVTGLAARVADGLGGSGFRRGVVGNAEPGTRSVVRFSGSGGEVVAGAVAGRLGGLRVERTDDVAPGHVEVLLGLDFSPASAVPAAPTTGLASPAPEPAITAAGVPCID